MNAFLEEFKTFALRGNVVDLAVAVVIGAAFGKIVSSLVDDVFMPIVGILSGGVDLSALTWTLKEASDTTAAVTVKYGLFLNSIVTFLIIAFVVFVLVKVMNKLKRKEEEAPATPPKPSKEEALLVEIRDLLKR